MAEVGRMIEQASEELQQVVEENQEMIKTFQVIYLLRFTRIDLVI